jgi:hypothetical protein
MGRIRFMRWVRLKRLHRQVETRTKNKAQLDLRIKTRLDFPARWDNKRVTLTPTRVRTILSSSSSFLTNFFFYRSSSVFSPPSRPSWTTCTAPSRPTTSTAWSRRRAQHIQSQIDPPPRPARAPPLLRALPGRRAHGRAAAPAAGSAGGGGKVGGSRCLYFTLLIAFLPSFAFVATAPRGRSTQEGAKDAAEQAEGAAPARLLDASSPPIFLLPFFLPSSHLPSPPLLSFFSVSYLGGH